MRDSTVLNRYHQRIADLATPDLNEPSGFVYFLLGYRSDTIKIGYGADFRARISSVRCHSPEPLILPGVIECANAKVREREVHGQFAHLHRHGEWFDAADDLLRFIGEHTEPVYDDHWELTNAGHRVEQLRGHFASAKA